ncbi:hypothetical protein ACFYNO_08175 [Kitasatospora sp. NPDC006697]|uniref:hypothetical protein n=1 Tax=Kitasatospora sp. NPDC006697 TaxID=3364020 RepID=UPI0036D02180
MTSTALESALAFTGLLGGIGLLGYLVGRDVDDAARQGRDNWHRPGGYPTGPARSDRPTPAPPQASAKADHPRRTAPDLRIGTLVRWTSSSAPRPRPISTPPAK